jgi:hypothetical protein
MRASTIIAIAGSSLVAAAPTPREATNTFEVTDFSFGCTNECYWSFSATVTGNNPPSHPAVETPVTCSGSFTGADPSSGKQYNTCSSTGNDKTELLAMIDRETNILSLLYLVNAPEDGNNYRYLGQQEVYSATGPDAEKQEKDFSVPESFSAATPIY